MKRGTDVVIRLRPTGVAGRHGDRAPETQMAIPGCHVLPRTSSEEDFQQNTVIVGLTLVAPGGTDIRADDRILWEGRYYEVEGEPGDYRKRGNSKAVIVALKGVTG